MTITTEQSVALAEKHGLHITQSGCTAAPMVVVSGVASNFAAMLNDYRQHVIKQLAQDSGVMPSSAVLCGGNVEREVRDALASMQARVEQLEEESLRLSVELAKAKGMDLS